MHITSLAAINATTLMAGTTAGLFLTTNSGTSWKSVNGDLHHLDITAITKVGTRIFIAAREGGIYASDNNGTSWIDFNDSNTKEVNGTIALIYNSITDRLMVLNSAGFFVTDAASTVIVGTFSAALSDLPSATTIYSISNSTNQWYLATDKGMFISATSAINW